MFRLKKLSVHALPGLGTLNIFEYEISLSCGKFRNYHREPLFGHGNTFDRGRPVGAAALFSPMHTRRRTLNKLCEDDFAFVSEFPHREKANQKKDWQAKKEHELTESLYRQVTLLFFRKFKVL